ncbi:uvrB/uvrC motif family protein [Chlamydia ibidis]|uniref:UvrB/uvrC motif family protein n=2 Tax=Chlamydia ibidis TaxID=1405396 RepID=S7J224_9CHLA|nr:uvrB/uvrC motif family protein [Chlamydia ibidis]EQM63206.1 uvrB/uvrC motif family protein [Chlamydia ibidis 10-1398/6]
MTTPETPLCYHCQQPAKVSYTEVDKDKLIRCYVCESCPYPTPYYSRDSILLCPSGDSLTLECGNCKTIWQVRPDEELSFGCHLCYVHFKTQLLSRLTQNKWVSPSFILEPGCGSLHVGRSPGELSNMNPLLKLIALNEALQDTLAREDYEQAALIRDQINNLKNQNTHDSSQ